MPKNATRTLVAAALLWGAFAPSAFCQGSGLAQEEADCEGDAFHFCSQYIPNRDQIHACLVEYRNEISEACRSLVAPRDRR